MRSDEEAGDDEDDALLPALQSSIEQSGDSSHPRTRRRSSAVSSVCLCLAAAVSVLLLLLSGSPTSSWDVLGFCSSLSPPAVSSPSSPSNSSSCDPFIRDWSESLSPLPAHCPPAPRVLRPKAVMWPGHPRLALAHDMWFNTPMDLAVVGYFHEHSEAWGDDTEPKWGTDVQVWVNGEQNITGRFVQAGESPNGRFLVFHLFHPVTATNYVTFTVHSTSVVHHNLTVLSTLPVTADAVFWSLFKYDMDLVPIAYSHYKRQGFDRIVLAYNGQVTEDVLAQLPRRSDVVVLEWDYEYMIAGRQRFQQALITLLTWSMHRLLPQVEWVMYADLDEYAVSITGESVVSTIREHRPHESVWMSLNQWAYVDDGWRTWATDFAVHGNTTTPLQLRPKTAPEGCGFRAKTLYHRSFSVTQLPLIGAHHPLERKTGCNNLIVHYHVLNFRIGITSGNEVIEEFGDNVTLIEAQSTRGKKRSDHGQQ